MNSVTVKAYVEAFVFLLFAAFLVYAGVTGTVIDDPTMWLVASVILGYFGFSAVEHFRRSNGQ